MDAVSFDINPQTFQADVIERSNTVPVLVLFWADQAAPSVQTKQMVEGLVAQYQGKVLLALADVAKDQTIAQHLRVQGLPAIRVVHNGKIVDQVDGPVDESQLRTMLDALTQSPADLLKNQLDQILASGDWETALSILQQAVQDEPNNAGFRVELADVLVRKGDLDDAKTVLVSIAEETAEIDRPRNRLAFAEEAADLEALGTLQSQAQADPNNLDIQYQLCIRFVADEQFEEGLDCAMTILQTDREFRDDIGRLTLIRVFAVMGKGNEVATRYRRRMFNFMH